MRFGLSTCQGLSLSLSLSLKYAIDHEISKSSNNESVLLKQWIIHLFICFLPVITIHKREREREEITIQGGDDIVDPYNASAIGCTTTLKSLIKKDPRILNKISLTTYTETPLHISVLLVHLDFTKILLT